MTRLNNLSQTEPLSLFTSPQWRVFHSWFSLKRFFSLFFFISLRAPFSSQLLRALTSICFIFIMLDKQHDSWTFHRSSASRRERWNSTMNLIRKSNKLPIIIHRDVYEFQIELKNARSWQERIRNETRTTENVLRQFRRFSEAMTTRWTRMRRYKRANKRERFGNLINYVIHFKRNDKMLMESKLFLFVFRLSSHCWSEHRTGGGGSCKEWISYHYSIYWR